MLYHILSSDAYWTVNKKLAKKIGLMETILLADLISKQEYFKKKNMLTDDGYFFNLQQELQQQLDIGEYKLRLLINNLQKSGFLLIKKQGVPAKNYYKINEDKILETLSILREPSVPRNSKVKTRENHGTGPVGIAELTYYNNNKNNNNKFFIGQNNKNSQKLKRQLPKITNKIFDKFWEIYPRKINKGKALKSWEKLCNKKDKPTFDQIRNALERQKKTKQWQNEKYIPHPTTWLNNYGWLNDYSSGWDNLDDNEIEGIMNGAKVITTKIQK